MRPGRGLVEDEQLRTTASKQNIQLFEQLSVLQEVVVFDGLLLGVTQGADASRNDRYLGNFVGARARLRNERVADLCAARTYMSHVRPGLSISHRGLPAGSAVGAGV